MFSLVSHVSSTEVNQEHMFHMQSYENTPQHDSFRFHCCHNFIYHRCHIQIITMISNQFRLEIIPFGSNFIT